MLQWLGTVIFAGVTYFSAQAHSKSPSPNTDINSQKNMQMLGEVRPAKTRIEQISVEKSNIRMRKRFRDPPVGHFTKINPHNVGMKGLTFEYGGGSSSGGSHYGF
jgi:hypothetical protein